MAALPTGLESGEDHSQAVSVTGPEDEASRAFALAVAQVMDETKAQDVRALHVAPLISWTSYMVMGSVLSKPQLLACMGRLERMIDEDYPERIRQNQPGSSPWECLDYGDVVVHLFTAEQREIYDIEGFYAGAEEVEFPWELPLPLPLSAAAGESSGIPVWSKERVM
eukprot:CAMPEP_0119107582 /NCGR_PEP_ID=MMETSP1180-20130426/11353_1 /TAXON_ID=3052 ORGANISM="Chlamydomonas cf sp, Strain CCMP681" /NCGR_SAMPLE_ID=MMETSP1180 /ASSEMBLY_ACC=CAM_ASM_000741 /LENGTH=166 /DNA_ID=CAMNT_0007093091 /DNA_START=186 /DNA_END=686 /DNA_ORIENTATION=+